MSENNKNWYIVQVVTGYEQKVKDDLENRDFDQADIEEILLPMKEHTTKTGKITEKPMFPGYLYVNVEMTDESWFIIRNTNYVTGIIGSSGHRTKPTPVRDEEIARIKEKALEEKLKSQSPGRTEEQLNTPLIEDPGFEIGDTVSITEGDFATQQGVVNGISIGSQTANIEIEVFGRMSVVELSLKILKKV